MEELTPRQNQIVSALISYPTSEDAAQALGIQNTQSLRNAMFKIRKKLGYDNNYQVVRAFTLAEIVESYKKK